MKRRFTKLEIVKMKVDEILAVQYDDEKAHSMEDKLHFDLVEEYCPVEVIKEIHRLNNAKFNRWCA